jgi:hypothetical protein
MGFSRAKQFLVTVTAMLSLFVSAVSACTCSHHEPGKKAIENTCHGSSYEVSETDGADPLATHIGSDCSCLVVTSPPASGAKSDDTRKTVDGNVHDFPQIRSALVVPSDGTGEPRPFIENPQSNYQLALLTSLPSRAPPSL